MAVLVSSSVPARFACEPLDRVFWFGARSPLQFAPGFEFIWATAPGDHDLAAAVRSVVRRYPILGCRLRPGAWGARWETHDQSGEVPVVMPLVEGGADEADRDRLRDLWLNQPLRPSLGELWRIHRAQPKQGPPGASPTAEQWWVVVLSHAIGDARGWSLALDSLLRDLPAAPPHPEPDRAPRDLGTLLAGIPPGKAPPDDQPARLRSPWPAVPAGGRRQFAHREFSPPAVQRLKALARTHGATLTDLVHAATVRACAQLPDFACPSPSGPWIRLVMPVDGRRHTRTPMGIGNLSGHCSLTIACPPPADLSSLLAALVKQKNQGLRAQRFVRQARRLRWRRLLPLWGSAALYRHAFQRPGPLSALVIHLDETERLFPHAQGLPLRDIRPVVPAVPANPCVVAASIFAGRLEITISVMEGLLPDGRLEEFAAAWETALAAMTAFSGDPRQSDEAGG